MLNSVGVKCFVSLTKLLSIVLKWCAAASSQVAMLDVSAAILGNSFKTSAPFSDTVINETLWEFLPLGYYRALQFFHRLELSLVLDSLLKSTPNSVIHGINIRAIWRPHMWASMNYLMCFFSDSPGGVRWRSILLHCLPVMTTYCSDVRQQTLLEDDIAVNFRSRVDEDLKFVLSSRTSY